MQDKSKMQHSQEMPRNKSETKKDAKNNLNSKSNNQQKKDDTAAGSERQQSLSSTDYGAVKTRTPHDKASVTGSDNDGQS